jgi:hypothetical protein
MRILIIDDASSISEEVWKQLLNFESKDIVQDIETHIDISNLIDLGGPIEKRKELQKLRKDYQRNSLQIRPKHEIRRNRRFNSRRLSSIRYPRKP